MKIALDLDGVVYNFAANMRAHLVQNLGADVTRLPEPDRWAMWEAWGMSSDAWHAAFDVGVRDGHLFNGGREFLYTGALDAVRWIEDQGHDLHIVTHRPEAAEALTCDWLVDVGLGHLPVTFSGDKTCIESDLIIEDNVDNALAVIIAGGAAILVDRPWNRRWQFNGCGVRVDSLPAARTGMLRRAHGWWNVAEGGVVELVDRFKPRSRAFDVVGTLPPMAEECYPADAVPLEVVVDTTNPKDLIGQTKPQLHLIPPAGLAYIAKVMELGAAKYGAYNWREKDVRLTVYLSAMLRHILQELDGEDIDPESGMSHLAHVAACALIVLDAKAGGQLVDDRPEPGPVADVLADLTVAS